MNTRDIDIILELRRRVGRTSVLFFDMDGTLIDTSYANFLAYSDSIKRITGRSIAASHDKSERFTRNSLEKIGFEVDKGKIDQIIKLKNELFGKYLPETKENSLALSILREFSSTNRTVLVTNCQELRAIAILEHYGILDLFSHKFFKPELSEGDGFNKYAHAINALRVNPKNIFAFENEKAEIEAAVSVGIIVENIYTLHNMEEHA